MKKADGAIKLEGPTQIPRVCTTPACLRACAGESLGGLTCSLVPCGRGRGVAVAVVLLSASLDALAR